MNSIPSTLYSELREALLDCGPFRDDNQLRAVFAHAKLSPWRHSVPQVSNLADRVDTTIAFLVGQHRSDTKENALVIFLRVLSERLDPADACHPRLLRLAAELEPALRGDSPLQRLVQNLREQIAQGEVGLAFDRLQNYLSASAPALRDEVIGLEERYDRLRRDERKGIISRETAEIEQDRLVNALLEFLEQVPDKISQEMSPSPAPKPAMGKLAVPEEVGLETILGINNLKQISWIERGLQVSKSICRILTPGGLGTGFLIAADLLMTNHHVIPDTAVAAQSVIEFNYQHDFEGKVLPTCRYKLDTGRFRSNPLLDYTIVGVLPDSNKPDLESWGCTFLNPYADPVPGEHVAIIPHPNGGLKQIVLTANQVVGLREYRLHYTTDTMPGSSGSPVFNDLWQVIAIHHAGGALQVNARGDKRFVNEGILMSAIKADAGSLWPG
jgi:endonuclease G